MSPQKNDRVQIDPTDIVRARLVGDMCIPIAYKHMIGFCHNPTHPGKLTRKILEQHGCVNKKCRYFEKYADVDYWKSIEKSKQLSEENRRKKNLALARAKEEAQYFDDLKTLFQSYADDAGYAFQIVRVKGVQATINVFYVSDNTFADWNRFPKLFQSIHFFFPHHRVRLHHLMDTANHYLTRDEYRKIKR